LYFPNDEYQYLPKGGYKKLFDNILNHKNIKVLLNTKFDRKMEEDYDYIFNSMAIDEYYDFCYSVFSTECYDCYFFIAQRVGRPCARTRTGQLPYMGSFD
jgi:UDP-galactopyranose mutase